MRKHLVPLITTLFILFSLGAQACELVLLDDLGEFNAIKIELVEYQNQLTQTPTSEQLKEFQKQEGLSHLSEKEVLLYRYNQLKFLIHMSEKKMRRLKAKSYVSNLKGIPLSDLPKLQDAIQGLLASGVTELPDGSLALPLLNFKQLNDEIESIFNKAYFADKSRWGNGFMQMSFEDKYYFIHKRSLEETQRELDFLTTVLQQSVLDNHPEFLKWVELTFPNTKSQHLNNVSFHTFRNAISNKDTLPCCASDVCLDCPYNRYFHRMKRELKKE